MDDKKQLEEWLKEVEQRPNSAQLILRLITGRLSELTRRNQELTAENIALLDGTRVEEYRQRIAYLEYQLELLKRQFSPEGLLAVEAMAANAAVRHYSLMAYQSTGRFVRIDTEWQEISGVQTVARIGGSISVNGETPRLVVLPAEEEALMLFSSGRVTNLQISAITEMKLDNDLSWDAGDLPDEPRGGEMLSSLVPFSAIPLSDFILQVSRRGCLKKTMASLGGTILTNHFIGRGTLQKADQPFEAVLCCKGARLALVTFEGRLLEIEVDNLSYSTEERIRLEPHDHVIAAFVVCSEDSLIFLTQNGKVLHRQASTIEATKTGNARGLALISPSRLEQGTRFVGAAAIRENDHLLVLDESGTLTMHSCAEITGSGALSLDQDVLAMCVFPAPRSGSD